MVQQKITAIMIIEVAGRPPEYLTNSMQLHIEKLNQLNGVRLVSSKISEPRVVESEKDLYTCFAEVEVEADSLARLMDLVFDFMPSSMEIIDPVDLELNCQEATMFVNDLAGRLHKYDEVAKIARMQVQQLTNKLVQGQQTQQQAQRPASPIQPIKITMNPGEADKKQKTQSKKSNKSKRAKK